MRLFSSDEHYSIVLFGGFLFYVHQRRIESKRPTEMEKGGAKYRFPWFQHALLRMDCPLSKKEQICRSWLLELYFINKTMWPKQTHILQNIACQQLNRHPKAIPYHSGEILLRWRATKKKSLNSLIMDYCIFHLKSRNFEFWRRCIRLRDPITHACSKFL